MPSLDERVAVVETVAQRNREDISQLVEEFKEVTGGLAHLSEKVDTSVATTTELKEDVKSLCRSYKDFVIETTSQTRVLTAKQKIVYGVAAAGAGGLLSLIVSLVTHFWGGK